MFSSTDDLLHETSTELNNGDHHDNYQTNLNSTQDDEEAQNNMFRYRDIFVQKSVFYPLLVVLTLMFLFQFSGQGAITFYTALIFREAQCSLDANDCALIIGVTYFLSSILGLVLKKHFGRRALLLLSEFGMALSQISLGVYFYMLNFNNVFFKTHPANDATMMTSTTTTSAVNSTFYAPSVTDGVYSTPSFNREYDWVRWLPIPILMIFTLSFNIGMGSLTWVVATEISPLRSRRFTHTVANVTSNFWWFVVTKTFKDVYREFGPHVPFFLYGSICLLGFVFIYVFLPETQGLTAEGRDEAFRGIQPIIKRVTGGCIRNSDSRGSTNPARNTSLECLEQQPLTENSPSPSNTTPLKQQNHVSRSSTSSKASESIHAMYQMRPLRKPSSSSPNLQHIHPSQQRQASSMNFSNSPSISGKNQIDNYQSDIKDANNTTKTVPNVNSPEERVNMASGEEHVDSAKIIA